MNSSSPASNRSTRSRLFRYRLGLIALLLLLASGSGLAAWVLVDLPRLERLEAGLALPSTRLYERHGQLLYEILPQRQGRNRSLSLAQLPQHCQNAIIATEDANFYQHPGVDPIGILRALWINLRGGEILAGGSTITQQTVRLLLLDPQGQAQRSLHRKLREMALALQMQARFSKDEILALYLNQVYFGNLAYGLDAAARAYFQKDAPALSLAECALLAGIAQNALYYDPLTQPARAKARQAVTLRLMAENGYISETEAQTALADELQFAPTPFPIEAPHFVMQVWRILERDFGAALHQGGLQVRTTVDLAWTQHAQDIVQRQLAALNHPIDGSRPANAHNAALVALDPRSGEVLTMLGSPDYFAEDIDGALNAALAYRQPGSALKPFTYAEAMNPAYPDAYTAATMLLDVRTPFITDKLESYVPANYGLVEHGPVLLREALASSYNIPAVIALEHIGLERFLRFVTELGLENLRDNARVDLSITLGGGEVRLIDLAEAYSALANGGYDIEPQYILSIQNAAGKLLYEYKAPPLTRRLIDPRVAYIITDILADNAARLPAFGENSPLKLGFPAAAKTGTTTDFRDNWVMGYTPQLVVGLWLGNADNAPMFAISGVSGAGPIYNLFMRTVSRGMAAANFEEPPGLTRREVCRLSGLLPTDYCPRRISELFIAGTEPSDYDTFYQPFRIGDSERVFLVLPPAARAWAARAGLPQPPLAKLVPSASQPADMLTLTSPDPYSIYEIAAGLPRAAQRLRFAVAAPADAHTVRYMLNGLPVASVPAPPWDVWWSLEAGEYNLQAMAELVDGRQVESAPLPFSVVERPLPASYDSE